MTTEQQKDAAAVRVFPPGVPLAVILFGVALNTLWPIAADVMLPAFVRFWLGGLIIAGAFLVFGVWAVITMRRAGQSENPWKPTFEVVEHGPYRITRNPMYLQMVLVCLGLALVLQNVWILLLTPVGMWVLQKFAILPEEAYLERKFGEPYRAYQRRVRRWL